MTNNCTDIFRRIKYIDSVYKQLTHRILKSGRLPLRSTNSGFWGFAPIYEIYELFRQINLQDASSIIDLGSGDGRIVAVSSLFTKAKGIESDKELYNISKQILAVLHNEGHIPNTPILNDNYLEHDLSVYDYMFINPDQQFSNGLEKKLLKELKGTLVVYEDNFKPLLLKKIKTIHTPAYKAHLYRQ
jgi:hypothetical protein